MQPDICLQQKNQTVSPGEIFRIVKKRLVVLILLIVITAGGFFLWFKEATSAVNSSDQTSKIFTIPKGENIRQIANKLENEGLIRDSLAFFLLVKKAGVEKNIQAGDFRLSPAMRAQEIVEELQHGTLDIWVTIPEGWRSEEIALKLAQELDIPEQEFLKHAQEGYMFPDTYLFPKNATASNAAQIMLDNFDKKVRRSLQEEIAVANLNLDRIIIIASLIEREAKFAEDRPYVASVISNRLNEGMKLDIDATVQYALGYQPQEKSWWKKSLTLDDLKFKSLYNTYINNGLPPGPIANPGLSSIQAAVNPEQTDYLYYISDQEGKIHLAQTYEQHQQNVQKYIKEAKQLTN